MVLVVAFEIFGVSFKYVKCINTLGMKGREDFFKVYSNLSLDLRKEIILVIDKKPITWNVAFEEIHAETKLGDKILEKLIELELI